MIQNKMKNHLNRLIVALVLLSVMLTACTTPAVPAAAEAPAPDNRTASTELILATTTSTRDSGLLDVLIPIFEQQSGYTVKVVAVGSGQALKMGEEGNADVLLVHAPKSEQDYMDKGFGVDRRLIMHNDFIIVGPAADPAGIKGTAASADALKKIAGTKSVFVSRGDDSGTHKAELALWKAAGIEPAAGSWYLQSGQGMGETLRIASEKEGYTLTDRASYLSQKDTLALEVMVEGEKSLLNIYHVITVNPEKWPLVNVTAARAFADFLVSAPAQKIIGGFGVEKYGQPLFFADAGKPEF